MAADLVYLQFLGPGDELTIIHVFGDADAMDIHAERARAHSPRAMPLFEPLGWEITEVPAQRRGRRSTRQASHPASLPEAEQEPRLGGCLVFGCDTDFLVPMGESARKEIVV